MNRTTLERIARRLKVLGDPTRLEILQELDGRERCVGEIASRVGGSQANVSKHLGVLRSAGIVSSRRDGMNVYYRTENCAVFDVCRLMCRCVEQDALRAVETLETA